MKRKLLFLLLMLAFFPSAFAQVKVHVEEAGTLADKLEKAGYNLKTITDLVVTGTVNQEDFRVMNKIMTALLTVDVSGTDITSIPDNAFESKSTLQKCIIPAGLQTIGSYAFRNCSQLVNLPFGQSITSIGNNAFDGCNSMKGDIVFPSSLTWIGEGAFQNCNTLTSVDMSKYRSYQIPNWLFQNCSSIRKVVLPEQGQEMAPGYAADYQISYGSFSGTGITDITIPAAVSSISNDAFSCYQLKTINVQRVDPPMIEESTFGYGDKTTCQLNVPTSSLKAYSFASFWSAFSIIEETGIQAIIGENGSILHNGEIVKTNDVIFHNAQKTTFTIVPNPGYTVDKVTFNKQEVTVEGNTIKVGSGIKSGTLNVNFILKKFNLNVTTEGNGKLKYNEELLPAQHTLLIDSASTAQFTLLPDEGYAVKSLLYNKVESAAQQNDAIYTTPFATGNADLVVTFAAKSEIGETYKISTKVGEHGNATFKNAPLLAESDVTVKKGETAIFTILPDKYYMIDKVLYNQVDVTKRVSAEGIFTTEAIDADAILEVTFKLNPVVTVNVDKPGTLKELLTEEQMKIITHLTLTGPISDPDFNTMRDDMTMLSVIDMSKAVVAFGGAMGNFIPDHAFSTGEWDMCVGKGTLTEVKLPVTITMINSYAFANCINLKYVNFEECTELNSINSNAFKGTGLISADLSQTKITSLASYNSQFNNCKSLVEVLLPTTLTEISNAFEGCPIKSLDLSVCENMTTIQNLNCQSLEFVKLPVNLESISNNAFSNSHLHSVDMSSCTKLKSIGEYAFGGIYNLKNVKFSTSLTTIANNAFSGCGLTGTLELPSAITTIGESAFGGCNVTICKIAATVPPTLGDYAFGGDPMMGSSTSSLAAIFVPEKSVKAYKNAKGWSDYTILGGENKVEVTVTQPGNLAVDIMEQAEIAPGLVTHLTVHGAINSTDFGVMRSNMSVLYSLDLSDADADIIPQEAFLDKKILMEFKAPKNLTTIESQAFSGCTALQGILELPDGVTTINNNAFYNCTSLTGIKLSGKLRRIGAEAFYNCNSLTQEITFPEKLSTIEYNAFGNCTSLFGTMTLPASLESLGYSAFQNCSNLQKVDMSACVSITEIPGQLFSNCTNLETLLLPEKLRNIQDNAFAYCSKLNNLKFPATLYGIYSYAFNGCSSLSAIDLSSCTLLSSIGDYAFANCSSLSIINLPIGLTSIGGYAFSQCRALANISATNADPASLGDYVFQKVNTEVCILSIPTNSYNDYLTAQQWGAFVQMRKAIAITMNEEGGGMEYVNNADVEDEEEVSEIVKAPRFAKSETPKGAIATNGSSIYVKKNETVSFFIAPKTGFKISRVMYNDTDVTNEIANGLFTTPKVTDKANFQVSFVSAIPATGVTLNKNELTLHVSKTETLKATVAPESANNAVIWASSNPEIATVNANGLVTAIKAGSTQITVTTVDGGFTATCNVTVLQPATGVTLDKTTLTLNVAETETLKATVAPESASNKELTWVSNNPEIATVDANGLVTAIKAGSTQITVTTVDGGFTATCNVTVLQPATGVTLNKTTLTLNVAETETLKATVAPESASNKELTWVSNNPEIATVDANGLVTAIKAGSTQITVTTVDGGFTATCNVTVLQPATGVTLDKTTLTLNVAETETLKATVAPESASNKELTWASNNPEIATVDANGLVTAIKAGSTQITVTAIDGGFTATCDVTVNDPSGITSVTTDHFGIFVNDNTITITGVKEDVPVSIYSTSGPLITAIISEGTDIKVNLPVKTFYLIKIGNAKAIKIAL